VTGVDPPALFRALDHSQNRSISLKTVETRRFAPMLALGKIQGLVHYRRSLAVLQVELV